MENKYIDKEKEVANQERIIAKKKWQCMCPHCTETAINRLSRKNMGEIPK